ncbi:carbohydrate kinase family protein [Neobacillus jeddahensis]|uniref:carbohydrate kinase family protein n=1 Tax=Neobacillus jeddahensis TaxID=1461580 RepID=UPI00058BC1EB|nr:carbohydrate kinase family protein [Neobacillus jeddahensis]
MQKQEMNILEMIKANPFITEIEIAEQTGYPLLEVSEIISLLIQTRQIVGRSFVLPEEKSILCIGGANVDRKIQTLKHLEYGTSNPAISTKTRGGVARNIAENSGRIGLKTTLLACVGADSEGEWLLKNTKEFVDIAPTELVKGKSTGTYTAVLDEDGEMAIALADMEIYNEVDDRFFGKNRSYIENAKMILLDTNFPATVISQVINHCKICGIPICIATVSAPKTAKLPESLEGVTWLIANHKEAEALAKLEIASEGDFYRAAEVILNKGAEKVVITRGEKGLIYFTKDGEAGAIIPPCVPVVDVTGAGDSLIAGILFGYLKGLSTEDACKIGVTCSLITLQTSDTVSPELNQQTLQENFQKYFSKGVSQR